MMGLPFSWDRRVFGRKTEPSLVIQRNGFTYEAGPVEKQTIERVEALTEAAQRARLLLHTLPERLDRCTTDEEAFRVHSAALYEAEAALHFALEGSEPVSRQDPQLFPVSEGISEGSEP